MDSVDTDARGRREARRQQRKRAREAPAAAAALVEERHSEEEDVEALTPSERKRRARMIRNRASAAASRKRKNDRIAELSAQVAFLLARADAETARAFGERLTSSADESLAGAPPAKRARRVPVAAPPAAVMAAAFDARCAPVAPPLSPLSTASEASDLDLMVSGDFSVLDESNEQPPQQQQQHLLHHTQRCSTHESAAFVTPTAE